MIRNYRKPLVIIGPKLLLRHPSAVSTIDDMLPGTVFRPVLPDPAAEGQQVTRVVFVTGKHFYTIDKERQARSVRNMAVIRLEVWVSCNCCYRVHLSSSIEQRHSQPSEAVAGHPPVWSVGYCWRYETLFDVWHTDNCHLLQGPTFCGRMRSDLPKMVYFVPVSLWQFESWLPDSGVIHIIDHMGGVDHLPITCHWLVMSIGWVSVQRGLRVRDGRRLQGAENTYLCNSQYSCRPVFAISRSTAALLVSAGGSVFVRIGRLGNGAELNVPVKQSLFMPQTKCCSTLVFM